MRTNSFESIPPWRGISIPWALGAGFAGSIVNSVAIHLTKRSGIKPGTGGLAEMTLALGNSTLSALGLLHRLPAKFGPVGQELFHTSMGLVMALVYALFFYRLLAGPGWARGLLFCQIPWLLQALVVLPWMGAGIFGLRVSPITPISSFLLNAIYGITLGAIYRPKARVDPLAAPFDPESKRPNRGH